VVSFKPRSPYPQGKSLWYQLDRRLGGPQSRSGRGGEEKNSQRKPLKFTVSHTTPLLTLLHGISEDESNENMIV
jgi:hypothetical protein